MNVVKFEVREFHLQPGDTPAVEQGLISLVVYATDSSNRTVAGLVGGTYKYLAKVQRMWFLDEPGDSGIGDGLIAAFETHVNQRRCELCIIDIDDGNVHPCITAAGYKEVPNNGYFASKYDPHILVKNLFMQ